MNYQELKNWLERLPHRRPAYYDGDWYCARCGEPWGRRGLDSGDLSYREKEMLIAGEGCPSCLSRR